MKKQLSKRMCAPLVQDVLERFCNATIGADEAAETLEVSRSRLYTLRTEFLQARAERRLGAWLPGLSGGDRSQSLPPEIERFLRGVLASDYSYAFAASEVARLCGRTVSDDLVRRWAIKEGIARQGRPVRLPAHTRRWQRGAVGELWQLDASPHRWFGHDGPLMPLIDMLDDASRLQVGIRLCRSENLAAHIGFLRRAFEEHGLPLAIYVDNAALFRPSDDGRPTSLGVRLALCKVSLVPASSPQAKGKVERIHQVWQDRLVRFLRHHGWKPDSDFDKLNAAIDKLRIHRNKHETHREIESTPQRAWERGIDEGRSKLRSLPKDGWWPFIWSIWHEVTVGSRGIVHHEGRRFPTRLKKGERAVLCEHLCGHYSVLKGLPGTSKHPQIAFTDLPRDTY